MTLDFDLKFYVNRITNSYFLLFTDQTDYTVAGVVKGFYRIEYPDGLIVENTDQDNPDFTDSDESTTLSLRLFKFKLITGTYVITQKIYIDDVLYSLQRNISLTFIEPSITATNNSNVTTPSVSFLDSTDYTVAGYTSTKTRLFSAFFPTTSDLDGTEKTTSTTELIMVDSGNYYEGIYSPTINIDSTYTGTNHDVQWINEKSFEFDIRKFYGYANLITLIDNFKETVKTPKDEQTYQMVMSLYSHLIGRINSGDTDIQDLISEILELTTGSCGCSSYTYQSGPITVDEIPGGSTSFPYIDQVIYREWSDSIVFKSTSTVFHRVSGKIRWFKSKQNDNEGNPIFIDDALNDAWWEEITLGSSGDSECIVRTKFTYEGGPKVFALPYDPEGIFQFYVAGVLQDASLYSFAGSLVTFTGPISIGDKVDVFSTGCDFTFTDISTSDVIRIADFTYSGSSIFTLPEPANYIFMVFKNGKKIDPEDFDHTIDTDEITIIEELDEEIEADRITVYYAIDKSFYIASFDPLKDVSGGFAANDTAILNLSYVSEFATLNRKGRVRFFVDDPARGGLFKFYPTSEGLTPDNGITFEIPDGFAVRIYDGDVSVRWFGAVGDGTTDDTTALQAAMDLSVSISGSLFLEPGKNYKITSSLITSVGLRVYTNPANNSPLFESAFGFTPLNTSITADGDFYLIDTPTNTGGYCVFENITFKGLNSAGGIKFSSSGTPTKFNVNIFFRSCNFLDFKTKSGVWLADSWRCEFYDCNWQGCGIAVLLDTSTSGLINDIVFYRPTIENCTCGIFSASGDRNCVSIYGGTIESIGKGFRSTSFPSDITVSGTVLTALGVTQENLSGAIIFSGAWVGTVSSVYFEAIKVVHVYTGLQALVNFESCYFNDNIGSFAPVNIIDARSSRSIRFTGNKISTYAGRTTALFNINSSRAHYFAGNYYLEPGGAVYTGTVYEDTINGSVDRDSLSYLTDAAGAVWAQPYIQGRLRLNKDGATNPDIYIEAAGANFYRMQANATNLQFVYGGSSLPSPALNRGFTFPPLSAAPSSPTNNTIYCADRVSWDPLARGAGNPYLVFYNGITYKEVSAV